VAIALDGPYGPHHIPKKFVLITSLVTKKKIQLISIKVKRKIQLNNRWDKYIVPLPFNVIEFTFHEPLTVKKDEYEKATQDIIRLME